MAVTPAELLEVYRGTPQTLRALVRGLDDERARWRQDEDSWSVVEVVAHLADTEERAHERVRRMLTEDNPEILGYDEQELASEHNYRAMKLDDVMGRFEDERAAQLRTLETLDRDGWERPGHHNEFGAMTVSTLTMLMTAHDAIHLAQVARIVLDAPGG